MDLQAAGRAVRDHIEARRFREAESLCRAILARRPAHPAAAYTLAMILLGRGDYAEGWRLYEARWRNPEAGIFRPSLPFPEWDGGPVGRLLVWGEQGHGDQIMFARWIPELVSRGVEVTVVCRPALSRLFAALGVETAPLGGELSLPRPDAWCLMGSLPHRLGVFPGAPYLPSGADGVGIGVVTHGDPSFPNDANRSLPPDLRPELMSLGTSLHPESTGARDFSETADIVGRLRLVVTTDTAVAHLAGAMGKPVWILLGYRPDWRWGWQAASERSALYPSARLFRQPRPGDWRSVLGAVRAQAADI